LLLLGDLEERFRCSFGPAAHCANIQVICISVQSHFSAPNWRNIREIGYRFTALLLH
jgi:hypothetical protein